MKLVLLCAGKGTRLGSDHAGLPKPLTPTPRGRTILDMTLDAFFATGRVDEAILVVGYRHEAFESHAFTLPDERPVRLVHNPDYAEKGPLFSLQLGIAGLEGHDIVFGNGDTIVNPAAAARIVAAAPRGGLWLAVSRRERVEDDDLVARVDDAGHVLRAEKAKLTGAKGPFVSAGMVLAAGAPDVARLVATVDDRCRRIDAGATPDGPWHALVRDVSDGGGSVGALEIDGDSWVEVDTRTDLQRAHDTLV